MLKRKLSIAPVVIALFLTVSHPLNAAVSGAEGIKKSNNTAVTELNIVWGKWAPADYLQQIGARYEALTGIRVNIIQDPWTTFSTNFFSAMAAHSTAWDMVVGDSQWLGQSSTQGYYVDLTDFLVSEGIVESVTAATLTYYGEYPTGSKKYWAFPTEGDAMGWAYRKDLFENATEKAAFLSQYGYPLDVPATFQQLRDIATFFTRPDKGLYGVALFTQKDYDAMTMGFENMLFSWGARWQNPVTNEVLNVINSPKAVEAIQFYKDLYTNCQAPGLSNAANVETNNAFITGKAVMCMNYFGFFTDLVNPVINPLSGNTGFFANPAGPSGDQHAALGGQGISIISFISAERRQAARDFIKWFAREDVQATWASMGGQTCNKNVLKSDAFLTAQPFNPAFAQSMNIVMDFWNIPQYSLLLDITQNELYHFIVDGNGTAQASMDSIAKKHNRILIDYGYISNVDETRPEPFSLYQNYPNPFSSVTTFRYQLPVPCHLKIRVFNTFGQEVATLMNADQESGSYHIDWHSDGQPAGLYYLHLETDGPGTGKSKTVRKMLLVSGSNRMN